MKVTRLSKAAFNGETHQRELTKIITSTTCSIDTAELHASVTESLHIMKLRRGIIFQEQCLEFGLKTSNQTYRAHECTVVTSLLGHRRTRWTKLQ